MRKDNQTMDKYIEKPKELFDLMSAIGDCIFVRANSLSNGMSQFIKLPISCYHCHKQRKIGKCRWSFLNYAHTWEANNENEFYQFTIYSS